MSLKYRLRIPGISFDSGWPIAKKDDRDRMFEQVNALRFSRGLIPYKRDAGLDRVAQRRAELALEDWGQSNLLRHDNPYVFGDRYFELLPTYGFPTWAWAGENLWLNAGYPDPIAEAMRGLQNSPTHMANLLATDFTRIGLGQVFRSPSGVNVGAQVFIG